MRISSLLFYPLGGCPAHQLRWFVASAMLSTALGTTTSLTTTLKPSTTTGPKVTFVGGFKFQGRFTELEATEGARKAVASMLGVHVQWVRIPSLAHDEEAYSTPTTTAKPTTSTSTSGGEE